MQSGFEFILADGQRQQLFKIREDRITYCLQEIAETFSDPEEKVRAGLFYDLVTKYGYPNDKGIIDFEVVRTIGHPDKINRSRLDVIIYRPDGTPYAIFELKSPQDYELYHDESIKTQLFERAANEDKGSGNLKYLIYYTRYYDEGGELVEKYETIDYTAYKTWEAWEEAGRPNLRMIPKNYGIIDKPPKFIKGSPDPQHQLRSNVSKDELNRIANDLHNVLYGGGQHQNELFFNLIGLFLTKIYDEKIKDDGEAYDFQVFYEGDKPESSEATYKRINALYRGEKDEKTQKYSQCALKYLLGFSDEQLEKQKDIVFDANKVKYVVETLQGISFSSQKYDVLGGFFEQIVRTELKQTKGQYLTPHNIVAFIIKALDIGNLTIDLLNGKDGRPRLPYVIDPACGSGTFLVEFIKEVTNAVQDELAHGSRLRRSDDVMEFVDRWFMSRNRNIWARDSVYGIEINNDLAMASKVNMVLHGDGSANIFAADGLIRFDKYTNGNLLQIMQKNNVYDKVVNEQFDIVVSNPPFSVTVDQETAKQFPDLYLQGEKIFNSLKKETRKEIDTENLFIERYYQLLRPNGRLGVVLPDSVFDTSSNRSVRLFLFKYFEIKAVISLPTLAFAPYTTTKTSLLFARKKTEEEVVEWESRWKELEAEYDELKAQLDKLRNRKETDELQPEFADKLRQYVRSLWEPGDERLSIQELKQKYAEDLKQVDKEWWIFDSISDMFDYSIFMAHANDIGYKRGINREEQRPNELYQEEATNDGCHIIVDTSEPKTILDHFLRNVVWG